jgi:GNAT superfamily N-acetyltransferase
MSDVHDIRPFSEDERADTLAALNVCLPPLRRLTLLDWRQADAPHEQSPVIGLRLVVGAPVAGFLDVQDASTTTVRTAGAVEGELYVAPHARGRGIGAALYARAEAFARGRGAATLDAWFYQEDAHGPGSAFLQRRGFAEHQRRITSHLDLASFDAERFADHIASVERSGVRLLVYDEMFDSVEQRHRLYALFGSFYTMAPYEQWEAVYFRSTDWPERVLVLAETSGRWVGLSFIAPFNRAAGVARIPFTGMLPECRGRGIATALKVRAAALAQARGVRVVVTANRIENAPILAVNRALGFVPGPFELTYRKTLEA